MADHPLFKAHRRVTGPSTWGGLVGSLLATAYAYVTLDMPPGRTWSFLGLVVVCLVIASVFGDRSEQVRLKILKAIGDGTVPPTAPSLQRALAEVAAIADVSFWVNLLYWWGSALTIALAWVTLPGVPWSAVGRVIVVGLSLGPLVATLAHLMVLQRARLYQRQVIACGLSPQQALEAVPVRGLHLKRRLMGFTAVAIVTPMALIADMGHHRTERTLDRLAQTEAAVERQEILDEEQDSGRLAIMVVALLAVAVVVACGYAAGAALSEPMAQLAEETRRVAEGRLGLPKVTPAEDEQWAAASALMILELQLFSVVKQLQDAGERIGVSAGDLGLSSQQHQAGAHEQGAALTATSATTEELARSARQIATNATEVSMLATETAGGRAQRQEERRCLLRVDPQGARRQPGDRRLGGQAQQACAAGRPGGGVHRRRRRQERSARGQRRARGKQGRGGGPRLLAGGRRDAPPLRERDAIDARDPRPHRRDPRRHQRCGDGQRGRGAARWPRR
jgi:hypothetical protein